MSDQGDWSGALQGAITDDLEEDPASISVVSGEGLGGGGAAGDGGGELPYVTLLHAAARTVQLGEITHAEFIEGIGKLDAIADNGLKIYQIPALKNDLAGKVTEHQLGIFKALEVELHNLKRGLALMLTYPETGDAGDLNAGLQIAVNALNTSNDIKKKADAEKARIDAAAEEDKARRAAQAGAAEED